MRFVNAVVGHDFAAKNKNLLRRRLNRPVLVNPSRSLSADLHFVHAKSLRMDAVHGSLSVLPRTLITQRSHDINMPASQRRTVEIGRREDRFRIAKDMNRPVRLMHKDVVVNAEVRVVEIFVLASDLNNASVRQQSNRLSESLSTPNGRVAAAAFK